MAGMLPLQEAKTEMCALTTRPDAHMVIGYLCTVTEYNPVAPAAPRLAWCASMVERESEQAQQKALLPHSQCCGAVVELWPDPPSIPCINLSKKDCWSGFANEPAIQSGQAAGEIWRRSPHCGDGLVDSIVDVVRRYSIVCG